AALGPAGGPLQGSLDVFPFRRIGRTFVKSHDDVGTQGVLNLYRLLGAEKQRFAADVRPKGNPFFRDLPERAEAEHLESSAVGQDSAVPVHEAVQPSRLPDDFVPRAEV